MKLKNSTLILIVTTAVVLSFAAYQGVVKFVPSAEAAGGKVTNFTGGPFDPFSRYVLATNTLIHRKLQKLIR